MRTPEKIVILGATSAIAEHCARLWVAEGVRELVLVGRDAERLQVVADDLGVRGRGGVQGRDLTVTTRLADFHDPARIQALVDEIVAAGLPDIVLVAHGALPDQLACQTDLRACREALEINALSPVLFAEAFVGHMERAGRGTLALIGSVAGDRGRKSNYVYGAAKGLVSRYAEGLQHRLAGSAVKVVLIKPGPTDTPMTAHLKSQGVALAPVELVAAGITAAIARGSLVCYVPAKWRLIMLVIRHLPWFVFRKMDI